MPRVNGSATSASSARAATAARRPSIRLWAFVLLDRVRASGRDAGVRQRGLGDRRRRRTGRRLQARSAPASMTSSGTSGLFSIPARTRRSGPRSTAPPPARCRSRRRGWLPVFCSPPTSPALLVGDRGHRDGAELRCHRAEPGAAQQQRPGHDLRPGAGVEQRRAGGRGRRTAPGSRSGRPAAAKRLGAASGCRPRRPAAKARGEAAAPRCRSPRGRARSKGTAGSRRRARPGSGT